MTHEESVLKSDMSAKRTVRWRSTRPRSGPCALEPASRAHPLEPATPRPPRLLTPCTPAAPRLDPGARALSPARQREEAAAAAKPVAREHPNGWTPTIKAYKSENFLTSRDARPIRILCEYQETQSRLRDNGIWGTILFFGSARCSTADDHAVKLRKLEAEVKAAKAGDAKEAAELGLARHNKLKWICEYMELTTELARRITEWGQTPEAFAMVHRILQEHIDAGDMVDSSAKIEEHAPIAPIIVATGGGPGLMEAANKGAALVPNGRSIGMGISLPFEPGLNKYVTPELAFEYHYFFTRKFWMVYPCLGLVCTPGGYGTLDELFEVLTLKQTNKIKLDVPIVLLGVKYWKSVLNFDVSAAREERRPRRWPRPRARAPHRAPTSAPSCPATAAWLPSAPGALRVRHGLAARRGPALLHRLGRRRLHAHRAELGRPGQEGQSAVGPGPGEARSRLGDTLRTRCSTAPHALCRRAHRDYMFMLDAGS